MCGWEGIREKEVIQRRRDVVGLKIIRQNDRLQSTEGKRENGGLREGTQGRKATQPRPCSGKEQGHELGVKRNSVHFLKEEGIKIGIHAVVG